MFDPEKGPEVPLEVLCSRSNLQDDTKQVLDHFLRVNAPPPNPWRRPPNAREESQQQESPESPLEKSAAASPRERRLSILRDFVKSRLAMHESVEEIVAYARRHDPARALELLEAAQGLT